MAQMWISPTSENRITWSVTGPLLSDGRSEQNFMVSQFGPEEVNKACSLIEALDNPFGGTMADLIAHTPKENMVKILVEEKVFDLVCAIPRYVE